MKRFPPPQLPSTCPPFAFPSPSTPLCTLSQVMKDLDHPNVVKLYEVISSQADRKVLMVMEYVEVSPTKGRCNHICDNVLQSCSC